MTSIQSDLFEFWQPKKNFILPCPRCVYSQHAQNGLELLRTLFVEMRFAKNVAQEGKINSVMRDKGI